MIWHSNSMAGGPNNGQAGFTLIEMTIVLAIASLVFSVGAISLSALKGRQTPMRSAGEIARLMTAAHNEALDAPSAQSVTIDLKAKKVSGPRGERVVIPAAYKISVVVGRETVADTKVLDVHFLPDGTSSGAEILITAPDGEGARLDVNWLTGLSRISDAKT